MKIRKIHIDAFGKFKDYDLSLEEGLNIIFGNNEAGKSTLMNFILMIFYGSKSRSRDLESNIRNKYRPWDSSKMKGHIIFELKGQEFRIDRTFFETNKRDEVEVINNLTGESVEMEDPSQPGLYFFGLSYESFTKSLFIDSEDLLMDSGPNEDINQKLINLISTSDESVSYKETINRLEKSLYEFKSKSGKKGTMVDLEEEIYAQKLAYQEARLIEEEKQEIIQKLKRLEEEIALEDLAERLEKMQLQKDQAIRQNKLNEDRKTLELVLEDYRARKAQHFSALDEIQAAYQLQIRDLEDLTEEKNTRFMNLQKISSEREKLEYKSQQEPPNNSKIYLYLTILTIVFNLIAYYMKFSSVLLYVGLVLAIIFLGLHYYFTDKNKRLYLEKLNKEKNLLIEEESRLDESYKDIVMKISDKKREVDEYKLLIREKDLILANLEDLYKNKTQEMDRIKTYKLIQSLDPRIIELNQRKLDELKVDLDEKRASYLSKYLSYISLSDSDETRLVALKKEYERLKAYSLARFKNARYIDEVKAKIDNLEEDYQDQYAEYMACKQAIECLQEAHDELSQELSPVLNKKSQEVFSKLTNGRYDKLLISKDFEIKFEDKDQGQLKNWKFLSSGARDQAYLSLKIALAQLISEIEKPALFLDDIFVKFDEKRAKEGIDFLQGLSGEFGQIILFTCHRRICNMASDKAFKLEI